MRHFTFAVLTFALVFAIVSTAEASPDKRSFYTGPRSETVIYMERGDAFRLPFARNTYVCLKLNTYGECEQMTTYKGPIGRTSRLRYERYLRVVPSTVSPRAGSAKEPTGGTVESYYVPPRSETRSVAPQFRIAEPYFPTEDWYLWYDEEFDR